MKYAILASILVILASCSNQKTEQSIREEIASYKKSVGEINQKISALEKELNSMNSDDNSSEKILVETVPVTYSPFYHYIQVSGTAEAVDDAFISPELSGQIREIYVNEGDYVVKGQLLARLNTEVTESSIADMESSLELASVVFEKQERLWEKGIGSEIQYLNAKNNKESIEQKVKTLQAQKEMAMLRSPVNGIVDEIYKKQGELALPGVQLMQIVNLGELYINADVSETYLSRIREGESVKLEFPVYPELNMEAPIYRKGNIINPNNRTFNIQIKVKNPDNLLKPNILSVIHINDFYADSAFVIPSILIKQDITGSYIYTLQQQDNIRVAKKVYVTPGKSYLDKTMVLEGLRQGMEVIVEGFNLVSDGSEVIIKSQNAS